MNLVCMLVTDTPLVLPCKETAFEAIAEKSSLMSFKQKVLACKEAGIIYLKSSVANIQEDEI